MLKNKLKRWLAAAVSAVMLCGMAGLLPVGTMRLTEPIVAEAYNWDLVDDYPSKYKAAALDALVDEWKYYNRECTSFVAWRLNSRNGIAFHNWYGGVNFGNAGTWGSAARNIGITVDMNPAPGSVFWQTSGQYGHVAWVNTVNDNGTVRIEEYNWSGDGAYHTRDVAISSASGYIHLADINPNPTPTGKEMSAGAGQTIPDGDYWIYSGVGSNYYLDIKGYDEIAGNGKMVQLYDCSLDGHDLPYDFDTWRVTYQNNGYYKLEQKTSPSALNVPGSVLTRGWYVESYGSFDTKGQEWSIAGSGNGFTIQARCNSYYLDVKDGKAAAGTELQVWEGNGSKAQTWCFIPADPDVFVADGIYRIHSAVDDRYVLDVSGNVGEYKDGSNVQIWDDSGDDVFQITHDSHGYYYISEVSSGLVVNAAASADDYMKNSENIALSPKTDQRSKKWAFIKNDDGTYRIITQLNGYALDLAIATLDELEKGKNTTQFAYHGNTNQRWTLEPIELQSIKVDKVPDKTTYYPDEAFDPTGITVNAKYSGGYSFKIAKGLTYKYDLSKSGKNTVTVSYDINGQTLTDTFEVTVNEIDFKGSGTKSDPYLIENKSDLEKLRDLVNSEDYAPAFKSCYYLQTTDIQLNGEKWTPIGKAWANGEQNAMNFTGHYDGGNYWITGLNVSETTKFAGLFGCVNGGTVENLAVKGTVKSTSDKDGGVSVGGIVGEIQKATITNCCFIGDVTGNGAAVGGIAGYLWQSGTVSDCYHIGTVKTSDAHSAGGVVGRIQSNEVKNAVCTVENCYHVGKMEEDQKYACTIVGCIDKASADVGQKIHLINCYGLSSDGALCAGDNPDTNTAQAVKESVLKLMAPTLGDSFVKNSDSKYLDGYPVFPWQTRLAGDVNADGSFNIADAVLIHKWLVTIPDVKLANWEAGDMNGDGELNVRDLTLMKQALLNP